MLKCEPLIKEELFYYVDGFLYWTEKAENYGYVVESHVYTRKTGNTTNSHCNVSIFNVTYKVHRLIWCLHFGEPTEGLLVDHINRKRYDNRIENLRLVTFEQNAWNKVCRGVIRNSKHSWTASIIVQGIKYKLGVFENEAAAVEARRLAEKRLQAGFSAI